MIPEPPTEHNPKTTPEPHKSTPLAAARYYAAQCLPVFPLHSIDNQGMCTCGGPEVNPKCTPGKHPRTEHGHLDATTDPEQIREWWERWPDANIGLVTGARSEILVIDADGEAGRRSVETLEAKHGPLPATRTHKTGGGGLHLVFIYPSAGAEIRNSAGKLGPGLDVRGEGGYIVAPPSVTESPYEVLEDREPAELPPAWLELLRKPAAKDGRAGAPRATRAATKTAPVASLDGPTIPAGTRDDTLTSIAGRLHDGRELAELESELLEINARRCEPPLPERQVIKIAHSIHRRPPCKQTNRAAPEVLELLEEIEGVLWRINWRGMGELSARDVYVALIIAGRQYGTLIPAGVRISISIRALALAAAVSKPTVVKAIRRLIKAGYVRRDYAGRQGTNSGALVLLAEPEAGRANLYHSPTDWGQGRSGKTLRAPRLRWSAPEKYRRLGKSCGAVIDALEAAGGELTLTELAEALHKSRPRDLRRRTVPRLQAARVVECDGVTVSLARDWLDALNEERENAGEIDTYRLSMARYERERDAFRQERHRKPDPAPTEEEMTAKRNRANVVARDVSHLAEAPAEPPAPPSEAVEECNESEPIPGVLTPDEVQTLEAIRDFERLHGRGSFKWNQSGAKELFYSSPAGCWPSVEELERIAGYVEASGGLEVAA